MILTSGRLYKSDALTETLNNLTINDAGYYESDTANANYDKDNLVSNPKVATHTSDGKKRKVTETSNGKFATNIIDQPDSTPHQQNN